MAAMQSSELLPWGVGPRELLPWEVAAWEAAAPRDKTSEALSGTAALKFVWSARHRRGALQRFARSEKLEA